MMPPARDPVNPLHLTRAARRDEPFDRVLGEVRRKLRRRYGARGVVLTASGTEALTAALRIAFRERKSRRLALPAWGCYALAAAAVGAGAESVVAYDLDPETLAADPDSLERALELGADTVVVAHLYGFPAAGAEVLERVRRHDAFLVEDAAQSHGGRLGERPLGTLGRVSVLSFGRGKGITCGGGGAVLVHDGAAGAAAAEVVAELRRTGADRRSTGWKELGVLGAQWALARPELYRIPATLPFLGLGETRYRPPVEPRPIPERVARLLRVVLDDGGAEAEIATRRRNARRLKALLGDDDAVRTPSPVETGTAGVLRLPLLLPRRTRKGRAAGVLPAYPRLLTDLDALKGAGLVAEPERGPDRGAPGARLLRDRLHTAPVHGAVRRSDLEAAARWLRDAAAALRSDFSPSSSSGPADPAGLGAAERTSRPRERTA